MSGDAVPEGTVPAENVPTCYRHPDRESYIRCQRCDRNICPDCQRQASVGFQCVECVKEAAQSSPAARTRFGGVLRPDSKPIVTFVLLGLNILVYLAAQTQQTLVLDLWLIGQWNPPGVIPQGVAEGEWWRLFTSMFLHVDLWHIVINMFTLWVLGPGLEALLGRLRFTLLYLATGLAGSAVAYAFTPPDVPVLGASGALAGLFGATIVLARRMRLDVSWLIGILAINVVLNIFGRNFLSWQAHLGGLAAGFAIGAVIAYAPRERRDLLHAAGFVLVTLAVAGLVIWRTASLSSPGI